MRHPAFTLVEIILVLGIAAIILGASIPLSAYFLSSYDLASGRDQLVEVLIRARALSLANKNMSGHGVFLNAQTLTLFEGSSFATRLMAQDRVATVPSFVVIGGPAEIVFLPLSAMAAAATYTLSQAGKNLLVTVNPEGMIDY